MLLFLKAAWQARPSSVILYVVATLKTNSASHLPTFKISNFFHNSLFALERFHKNLLLKQPVVGGRSITDISISLMYDIHDN